MKEITIKFLPGGLELTPEAKALLEKIDNPQDLNDALLGVKVEEMAEAIADEILQNVIAAHPQIRAPQCLMPSTRPDPDTGIK